MIDLTMFISAFFGALLAIIFNKAIELMVLRAEIKRKKRDLSQLMEMTDSMVKLMEMEMRAEKADENNKTRKTK